ncbi:septal ring lytic transglycosylase RlpA family protein [Glaciimonas soli]|uniref:Endolytic peptidoglycan transglycosylase RlpA n=1 Tax=Glaciimonas soli TaxID=2590999 RepID=A0A843YL08_9BURK|nr:septal ring lytic transglycosylase RlpA family protein [Glaciimonas soli]MQR00539.1 septal ring lytic transglycosylase RlpA family protein [Glaciimonas soli]
MRSSYLSRYAAWVTLTSVLILAGCSTTPPSTAPATKPASSSSSGKLVLPPAGSGRGGYYKDDGPGDDIPAGLENTPDATPDIEPYAKTGNKPYVVFGKTYTPLVDNKPFKQRGTGSWYGKKFHNKRTSSGELYDMYKMSAAHPTLPIPSYARVTNLSNGKSVIVRINDRGPFHSSRIIDLSYTAALKLGYIGHGSTELEVERLLPADIIAINKNGPTANSKAIMATVANTAPSDSGVATSVATLPTPPSQPAELASGFYLQLGAYAQQANADAAQQRLQQQLPDLSAPLNISPNNGVYRLYVGPFSSRSEAENTGLQIRQRTDVAAIVVQKL